MRMNRTYNTYTMFFMIQTRCECSPKMGNANANDTFFGPISETQHKSYAKVSVTYSIATLTQIYEYSTQILFKKHFPCVMVM